MKKSLTDDQLDEKLVEFKGKKDQKVKITNFSMGVEKEFEILNSEYYFGTHQSKFLVDSLLVSITK